MPETHAVSPHQQEAAEAEAALLLRAENVYLRQRTVALNVQVRHLTAEVARLTQGEPLDFEPRHRAEPTNAEPGSE